MTANATQVTAVKDLHESGTRTLTGYDQTAGDYKFDTKDPYELRHAKVKLATPVTATLSVVDADLDIGVGADLDEQIVFAASANFGGDALTASEFTFTTSDAAVATVTAGGLIEGVAAGTATITGTTVNGLTSDIAITVANT